MEIHGYCTDETLQKYNNYIYCMWPHLSCAPVFFAAMYFLSVGLASPCICGILLCSSPLAQVLGRIRIV